jgi:hypothetical protein
MQKSAVISDQSLSSTKWLSLGEVATRFLYLALAVTIPPICLFIDLKIIGNGISENSATETSQIVLLLLSIGCFIFLARKKVNERAFFILAAAFFSCMIIRELDALFDLIAHGFWVYIATPIAFTAIINAIKNGPATLLGLSRFVSSQAGMLMLVAVAILLFYSRLIGMAVVWQEIMGDAYLRVVKNAMEETSELLGYSLIFSASLTYLLQRLRAKT